MQITDWLTTIFPKRHPRKSIPGQLVPAWVEILENRVLLSSQNVLVQSLTTLEGTPLDDVQIQFALTEGQATFEELGIFRFDEDGTVGGLTPGDAGFTDAVLARRTVLFQQGDPLGRSLSLGFTGRNQIGVYVCDNGPGSQSVIDVQMTTDSTFRLGYEETPSLWSAFSNGLGSQSRRFDDAVVEVTIGEVDSFARPRLSPISNFTTPEEQLFQLRVTAQNPEGPASDLRFRLENPPAGATIDAETGLLTWTPTEAQGPGNYNITVTVFNATRPDASASQTFTITVNEINTAPTIDPLDDVTLNEGELFEVTATASNAFGPASDIRFRLDFAPAGMTIDELTGELSWTPAETQGPGRFDVVVSVFRAAKPEDINSTTFTITVNEVNVAPVLAEIADQMVMQGALLTVQATATDADRPVNRLRFSLVNNTQPGARIAANTGVFTWTPSDDVDPGMYSFTVRVVDDGNPLLDDLVTFMVQVNPLPA